MHTIPIKAVLCDFDDTLVDTIGVKWQQHFVAAEQLGLTLTEAKIRQHWGEAMPQLISALYEVSGQDIQPTLDYFYSFEAQFPKVAKPGAAELLGGLYSSGVVAGIVTATVKANLLHELDRLDFDGRWLSYLQAADETDYHKPDPRVFEPALQYLQDSHAINQPREIVYIGDSLRDFYAARDAGLGFIGIPNGVIDTADDFSRVGAYWVEDLEQAAKVLLDGG